ncbi:hypothetical protein PWG71_18095 [Nocardiopsis sp. N85]|uniref:hypothetical protein n=1 Tax=Nocardiopsis sp. N85 TaxID=3029400 RepID=UPI00237F3AAD|nr:hypothetical protein [Nocardiopsis sp. N85]MDE3723308.1 hypothetical protein [Nocardiopsis sp. N85]
MSSGIGANPNEARQGGEDAEALATAMAGLTGAFELTIDDAIRVAGEEEVKAGWRSFHECHLQGLVEVQGHGPQLADDVQAGAGEIVLNDPEGSEELSTAARHPPSGPGNVDFY